MVAEGRAMNIEVAFGGMIVDEAEAEAEAEAAPMEPHNYYMLTVLEIQNYFG